MQVYIVSQDGTRAEEMTGKSITVGGRGNKELIIQRSNTEAVGMAKYETEEMALQALRNTLRLLNEGEAVENKVKMIWLY